MARVLNNLGGTYRMRGKLDGEMIPRPQRGLLMVLVKLFRTFKVFRCLYF